MGVRSRDARGGGCARTLRDNIRFWSMTVGCLLWPTEGFNSSFQITVRRAHECLLILICQTTYKLISSLTYILI